MILNKELEEMLKVYIDNNLQELKTKFPTIVNYNIQDNKYNTDNEDISDVFSFESIGDTGLLYLSNLKNKSISYSISKIIVNYENEINVSVVDTNTLQIEDLNELDLLNVGDIVSIEGVINDNVYIIVEVESSVDSNKYISSTHMTTNFYTNILVGSNKYLDNKENYLLILKEITKLFNFNSLQLKKDCASINFLVSYKTNKNNVDNLNNQVDYILLTLTLRENKNY